MLREQALQTLLLKASARTATLFRPGQITTERGGRMEVGVQNQAESVLELV